MTDYAERRRKRIERTVTRLREAQGAAFREGAQTGRHQGRVRRGDPGAHQALVADLTGRAPVSPASVPPANGRERLAEAASILPEAPTDMHSWLMHLLMDPNN